MNTTTIAVLLFSFFTAFSQQVPEHITFTIDSKILAETRVINVWLPPNYTDATLKFPVLYMLDGGVNEDFPHLATTISDLVNQNKIESLLLVGIENTQRRRDLTPPTQSKSDKKIAPVVGKSAQFRAFISNELFPEIQKRFRSNDRRGIIGESLAGLFVVETLLQTPKMFDYYIAFDPSLWWNNHYLVRNASQFVSNLRDPNLRFWFAGSGAKDMSKHTRKLARVFESAHLPNLKWLYADEPMLQHNTIFRATKQKAILWTLAQ